MPKWTLDMEISMICPPKYKPGPVIQNQQKRDSQGILEFIKDVPSERRSQKQSRTRRAVAAQGQRPSQAETQSSWCSRCNAGRDLWKLWRVDCSAKSQGLGNSYYMSKFPKKSWNPGRKSALGWRHCRKTSRPTSKTAMTERIAQGMDAELPCALVFNPHMANPQRWDTPTHIHTCSHTIHTHAWAHTPHTYTHRGPRAWRQIRLLLIFKSWNLSPFFPFSFFFFGAGMSVQCLRHHYDTFGHVYLQLNCLSENHTFETQITHAT